MVKRLSDNKRLSNIEAMRIFAMLNVVLVHCCYFSTEYPLHAEIIGDPLGFLYGAIQCQFTIVCVNCFVLISGYFGIKAKLKGVLNLLFILLFYKTLIPLCLFLKEGGIYLPEDMSLMGYLVIYGGDWFIYAYLLLMVFAPILNRFCEDVPSAKLLRIIIVLVSIEAISCILNFPGLNFSGGYSFVSFAILYLIGRWFRVVQTSNKRLLGNEKKVSVLVYIGISIVTPFLVLALNYVSPRLNAVASALQMNYDSPFVILSSFAVLVFFTSLKFSNRLVNWLGASAFSVYLIHLNPYILPKFKETVLMIYEVAGPIFRIPVLIAFACAIYLACAVVDQLRIYTWKFLLRSFDNHHSLLSPLN